jgi:hypothetical protein
MTDHLQHMGIHSSTWAFTANTFQTGICAVSPPLVLTQDHANGGQPVPNQQQQQQQPNSSGIPSSVI